MPNNKPAKRGGPRPGAGRPRTIDQADAHKLSAMIPAHVYTALRRESQTTGSTIGEIVRRALGRYLED